MRFLNLLILIFFSIFLQGCSALSKQDEPFGRDSPVFDNDNLLIIRGRVLDFYIRNDLKGYPGYKANSKELRNAVINDLLVISDTREKKWRITLKDEVSIRQIGIDSLGIGLAAAGSVASASLSQIFSAGSAAAQSINSSWDNRYIAERSIDSIMNAVSIERAKQKYQIIINMKRSINEYGVSDGIRDVIEYDQLLALQVGVSAIENSTTASLDAAKKALDTARGGGK